MEAFFQRQAEGHRAQLEVLRGLIARAAPEATASLKWGMPFYCIGKHMMCALGSFKAHVNLVLAVRPERLSDPDGLLAGAGRGSKHLKLRVGEPVPRAQALGWLRVAAETARAKVRSIR